MNFFKRLFSFGKKKKGDDVESDVNQSLDSEVAIEEDKLELKNKKIKPESEPVSYTHLTLPTTNSV